MNVLAALGVVISLSSSSGAGTAAQPPMVGAYGALVHSIRLDLDAQLTRPRWAAVASIRQRLAALPAVLLPDGSVLQTSLPVLSRVLTPGDPQSLRAVAVSVDDLDGALRAGRRMPVAAQSLTRLDAILRSSRFRRDESILQRFLSWAAEQIANLLSALRGAPAGTPTVLFLVIFVLLAAAGGTYIARAITRRELWRPFARAKAPTIDGDGSGAQNLTYAELAARRADKGDFRSALRYLLLGTMVELHQVALIHLREGWTNRENLAQLRIVPSLSPSAADDLSTLVIAHERVWYGHLPITAEEYYALAALAANIGKGVRRGRVA